MTATPVRRTMNQQKNHTQHQVHSSISINKDVLSPLSSKIPPEKALTANSHSSTNHFLKSKNFTSFDEIDGAGRRHPNHNIAPRSPSVNRPTTSLTHSCQTQQKARDSQRLQPGTPTKSHRRSPAPSSPSERLQQGKLSPSKPNTGDKKIPFCIPDKREPKWYFDMNRLIDQNPNRKAGIDVSKELQYRQHVSSCVQDIGQRLHLPTLCVCSAVVYVNRFYAFHTFSRFPYVDMAAAAIFLAAKAQECPRKLEHVVKVSYALQHRDQQPLESKSDKYLEESQKIITLENILLKTLGFETDVELPHQEIVRFAQRVKSRDLAQGAYFLVSQTLVVIPFYCLRYRPSIVACCCIYMACLWAKWEIPQIDGKPFYQNMDKDATVELMQFLSDEFLRCTEMLPSLKIDRYLSHLKKNDANSASTSPFSQQLEMVFGADFLNSNVQECVSVQRTRPHLGHQQPQDQNVPQQVSDKCIGRPDSKSKQQQSFSQNASRSVDQPDFFGATHSTTVDIKLEETAAEHQRESPETTTIAPPLKRVKAEVLDLNKYKERRQQNLSTASVSGNSDATKNAQSPLMTDGQTTENQSIVSGSSRKSFFPDFSSAAIETAQESISSPASVTAVTTKENKTGRIATSIKQSSEPHAEKPKPVESHIEKAKPDELRSDKSRSALGQDLDLHHQYHHRVKSHVHGDHRSKVSPSNVKVDAARHIVLQPPPVPPTITVENRSLETAHQQENIVACPVAGLKVEELGESSGVETAGLKSGFVPSLIKSPKVEALRVKLPQPITALQSPNKSNDGQSPRKDKHITEDGIFHQKTHRHHQRKPISSTLGDLIAETKLGSTKSERLKSPDDRHRHRYSERTVYQHQNSQDKDLASTLKRKRNLDDTSSTNNSNLLTDNATCSNSNNHHSSHHYDKKHSKRLRHDSSPLARSTSAVASSSSCIPNEELSDGNEHRSHKHKHKHHKRHKEHRQKDSNSTSLDDHHSQRHGQQQHQSEKQYRDEASRNYLLFNDERRNDKSSKQPLTDRRELALERHDSTGIQRAQSVKRHRSGDSEEEEGEISDSSDTGSSHQQLHRHNHEGSRLNSVL